MKIARKASSRTKHYPPGSFIGKLKKRRIIGTLAVIISGGWLVFEIVHWILVDHYHLPEGLKDIVIVSVVCVMLCALTWRWFRGEKRKRKIKYEFVLIPAFILIAAFINVNFLLHLGEKAAGPYGAIFRKSDWKNSVAVLPFVNMSAEKEQEYFCDGLTEELITRLSQIQELKVPARTSAFVFKGEKKDIREVGQRLGVDNVLEGSVRKSNSRLRISAQLINVANGYHLWSETYDRELDDIFMVQDEIARSVAGALKTTLLLKKRPSAQPKNTEAYEAYLMGRHFHGQQSRENLEKAIAYYRKALELDPDYARAWAGLGATLAYQANIGYVPVEEGYSKALAAVEQAMTLDESLAVAHATLGWIQMTYSWDWAKADASFQRALSLEPAGSTINAAHLAFALGRYNQALGLARRAVERDPLYTQAHGTLALAAYYSGRLEEAAAAFKKVLELSPHFGGIHGLLGQIYLAQSHPKEALAEIKQEKDPYWRLPGLALAFHAQGRRRESNAALAEFIEKYQNVGAYQVAQVYAFRGEADLAFEWLERAYDQHDAGLYVTKPDPLLKSLKQDPRYAAFLKKMGLPA